MPHTIAAPSWVTAGTIADNATFILAHNTADTENHLTVTEIGLCFFETASCLAYSDDDLPQNLASLPFTWHVHLPSDLPWYQGGAFVARIALKLMDKVAFLGAKKAVLHPPIGYNNTTLLRDFMTIWQAAGRAPHDIHIENIHGHDLVDLWDVIVELGCKICLDTGHLISYRQDVLRDLLFGRVGRLQQCLNPWQHIGMLHLCATTPSGRHAPLTAFSQEEQDLVAAICRAVPHDCTFMLELFKWEHIVASRPLLSDWLA